jgi:nucleoid-associated protein
MEITEAIFHKIKKEKADKGRPTLVISPHPLPLDELINNTAKDINSTYRKKLNNYGSFDEDIVLYPFSAVLKKYISNEISFHRFSERTSELISHKMADQVFATGGYVVFIRYSIEGRDFLFILMLKMKAGVGFDEVNFTLKESFVFDVNQLHEAACIDIDKSMSGESPYLSFIKSRSTLQDVTKYFREALGCTDYVDSKQHTKQLLTAIDEYSKINKWSAEQRQNARRKTHEYCEEKRREDTPVNLTALSAILNDQDPESFINFVREKEYPINETFEPDVRTYKQLQRVDKKIGNIRLLFDVEDLINSKIDYVLQDKLVIIRDVPEDILRALRDIKED